MKDYKKFFLVKCENCGFVFTKLIPTEAELKQNYENYGRNDYLSPVTIKRYNELLDQFEKFRKTNRILDIGCGIGYFLEIAKKRQWDVYGTEYTKESVKICQSKGITVYSGNLEDSFFNRESFDIITSMETIEHINNPLNHTQYINHLLRKDGICYVTTPNFNSLLRMYLKDKYTYVLVIPDHLCYYTPRTLTCLFEKTGFRKIKITTSGFSLTCLKHKNIKFADEVISPVSEDEKLRKIFESTLIMKNIKIFLNTILSILRKGDTIKATFKKI